MKKITITCDLCYADGTDEEAVAQYWDTESKTWDVCRKHLKDVQDAELCFEMLERDS